ncbi:MAG: tetratricopeptide repeat protein [Acidobacteriaceae bacterium]
MSHAETIPRKAGLRSRVVAAAVSWFVLAGCAAVQAQQAPLPPGTSSPDQRSAQPGQQPEQPSGPLADAENAIEAKNYTLAASRLDVYLSVHPNDARALFDRGYVEDAQGHTDAAEGWYRKAIAADPKQFESHLALGLILAAKGDPAAKEQLQAATQLEPSPPNPGAKAQADRALARLLLSSDPEAARDALVAALKISPETPDDALLTARIAEAAGNNDIAEEAWHRILQTQPDSVEAAAGLAHALIADKRYADAQPVVETALQHDPKNPTLNAQLAAILNAQGKQAEALTVLEKLHDLEPENPAVTQMVADAEAQAGNLDKASADYAELLAATPNDPGLLDSQGQVLIRQKQYAQAIAAFRKAVAARPDDVDAWSGIAFAASELHAWQLELSALSTRSKYAPENASTLFLWATAYDNLHQSKAAGEYYHRFLAAAQGKFPDQEWQAKHRLVALHQ